MAMLNPYQQYAQNQVTTATPEELPLLLYKVAVKFILLGLQALEQQNLEEANHNIVKAQNIYCELRRTLDDQYEISRNLASLYNYVIDLLIQGNIKKDKNLLEEALAMTKDFVETWEEAIIIYRRNKAAAQKSQKGQL